MDKLSDRKRMAYISLFRRIISGIIIMMAVCMFLSVNTRAESKNKAPQNIANVVVFAYFSGDNAESDKIFFAENREKILDIYDGESARSFTNYISAISYGQLQVKNIFPQDNGTTLDSYCLSYSIDQANNGDIDINIINEIVNNVQGVKDKAVDYNNDGYIDNLTIILRGGKDASGTSSTIYPHKYDYVGTKTWAGKNVGTYNILNTYRLMETFLPENAGLVAHEFMHSIGYPDLYLSNGSANPVYTWDIMAAVSKYLSYPLAYMRMYCSDWISIDTVTSSQTLTLDTQDNANGKQAYILKSPLNEHELFVVEFRKKPERNPLDTESLDYGIGGSGIIVYRVNTTVDKLSNIAGGNAVYVFRPQEGQEGYDSIEAICVQRAFLSKESGRTSIGSSNMELGLKDGALIFSDGTNSNIVISNVSSSAGNKMTLDVTIPKETEFDLWKDMGYTDPSNDIYDIKNVAIGMADDKKNLVEFYNSRLSTCEYINGKWVKTGNDITGVDYVSNMKIISNTDEMYLSYGSYPNVVLYKWNSIQAAWNKVTQIGGSNGDYDIHSFNNSIYITYIDETSSNAKLIKLVGTEFVDIGTYFKNEFCGQPRLCNVGNQLYVSVRQASGEAIHVYKYSESGFTDISEGFTSNTFDIVGIDGRIYLALGSSSESNLRIYSYDGSSWYEIESNISCIGPKLVSTNGKLYVLVSSQNGEGYTKVYRHNTVRGTFVQEGVNVDSPASEITLMAGDDYLYAAYVRQLDNRVMIKEKKAYVEETELSIDAKISNESSTGFVVGDTIKLIASASGGSGSYTYSYLLHNIDTGNWYRFSGFTESGTLNWLAGSAGKREFFVEVKDSTGKTVRSTAINVNVRKSLSIVGSADLLISYMGNQVIISGNASGGSGSYTYSFLLHNIDTGAWARLTKSFTGNNSYSWIAGSTGSREFFVEVKDSTGMVVRSSAINVRTLSALQIGRAHV